ncbi:ATP-binding protein [Streptosporangium sp. CA-135522]|uniref:ATP-binding protein n=1 Tax=Streptosporangium sp. CA-135522 TaxID=3240072 RepID=UPI003D8CBF0A
MPRARMHFTVVATPEAVSAARHRISAAVRSWGVRLDRDLAYAIELVASELLTNALVHAGGTLIAGAVLDADRLVVEVFDSSPVEPRPREANRDDEGGRGLALIGSFALAGGCEPIRGGKRCWALLEVPDSATPRQAVEQYGSGPCPVEQHMAGPRPIEHHGPGPCPVEQHMAGPRPVEHHGSGPCPAAPAPLSPFPARI